jgi:hypothetical protein
MSTYRKIQCVCGAWVTSNALGRASHERSKAHDAAMGQYKREFEQRKAEAEAAFKRRLVAFKCSST